MSEGKFLGPLGAAVVIAGVVGPFYDAPLLGSSSIFSKAPLIGAMLILCACAAAFYSLKDRYILVYAFSFVAWTISNLVLAKYFGLLNSIQGKLDSIWLGWLGRFLIDKVSLSWGAAAIVCGPIILIGAASALQKEHKEQRIRLHYILESMSKTGMNYTTIDNELIEEERKQQKLDEKIEQISSNRYGFYAFLIIVVMSVAFNLYGWKAGLATFLALGMAWNVVYERNKQRLKKQLEDGAVSESAPTH